MRTLMVLMMILSLAGCSSGGGAPASTPTEAARPDIQVANEGRTGEAFDLNAALPKDKTTLVEFYSLRCPPCLQMAPLLERLAEARPDLAIRKVDIDRVGATGIDFGSPVAQQYHIEKVPYFMIYEGADLKSQDQAAKQQVKTWMQQAGIVN